MPEQSANAPEPDDDAAAQRERLARWAWQQRESYRGPREGRSKGQTIGRLPARAKLGLRHLADRVLDRGLDTSTYVYTPEHLHRDRFFYVPSAWHVVPRALRYIGVSDRDTFVDFGCGKGRVVHQAARWPFARVMGVEISPDLAEIARANMAARSGHHKCKNVEIVACDVVDFPIPDDLTVAYFFQPFSGDTFDSVLRRIIDSIDRNPRRVRLIYCRPFNSETVVATGRFRLVKEQHGALRRSRRRTSNTVAIYESTSDA